MKNIKNFNDLAKYIDNEKILTTDVTNILKELDILPSTTTQAALNDYLVVIGNRILNKEEIILAEYCETRTILIEEYEHWLESNFTEYSYNMYKNTMKERG